jgi:hypothetical protein
VPASSDKTTQVFNSAEFAKKLKKNKRFLIVPHQIVFEEGWENIFEDFVDVVGNCLVTIRQADDRFNFLDIEADLSSTSKASDIYNAILKAKYDSLVTCARCGVSKTKTNLTKYCKLCNHKLNKSNKTGTWLDEY